MCDDGAQSFAEALDKLMRDRELHIQMGKAAKQAMAEYVPEKILAQWAELMKKVVLSK